MAWIDDFILWCQDQRQWAAAQLESFESGQQRLFHNNVDVSPEAIKRYQRTIQEMDALIERADRDRNA